MAKHAGEELWLYMGYMGLTRQWPDGASVIVCGNTLGEDGIILSIYHT